MLFPSLLGHWVKNKGEFGTRAQPPLPQRKSPTGMVHPHCYLAKVYFRLVNTSLAVSVRVAQTIPTVGGTIPRTGGLGIRKQASWVPAFTLLFSHSGARETITTSSPPSNCEPKEVPAFSDCLCHIFCHGNEKSDQYSFPVPRGKKL